MNWQMLFEKQSELMECIGYKGDDKPESTRLALAVEAAECANEWRGFKYWSTKRNQPNTQVEIECESCGGSGRSYAGYCGSCHGGYVGKQNPLLEEYTDLLHFALERVIEAEKVGKADINYILKLIATERNKTSTTTKQFNEILYLNCETDYEEETLAAVYHLGGMLGFSDEQIEAAYLEKWETNIKRQEEGY